MNTQAVLTALPKTKSMTMTYMLYRIYHARPRLVMSLIFAVLSFPLLLFGALVYEGAYETASVGATEEILMYVSIISFCVSTAGIVIITYLNGFLSYDYNTNRSVVDMSWSLPLTHKQRFWGDFFAGLLPAVVPYTLSAVLTFIVFAILRPVEVLEISVGDAFGLILTGLVFLIMLYVLTVFTASLSARGFEAAIYPVILMALIPCLLLLGYLLLFSHIPEVNYESGLVDVIACTSPFGFLIGTFTKMVNDSAIYFYLFDIKFLIPILVVIGGFVAAAFFLSKNRKAEKVGGAFAFKGVYTAFMSCIIFCITALFALVIANDNSMNEYGGLIFGYVLTTAVVYLIIDVITNRGFKKILRGAVRYLAMVICSVALSSVMIGVNGFGLGHYVPEASEVESVSVNGMNVYAGGQNYYSGYFYENTENVSLKTFAEENNIAVILSAVNSYMENHDTYGYSTGYSSSTNRIVYTLKNGREVTRTYTMSLKDYRALLQVAATDEYVDNIESKLGAQLFGQSQYNEQSFYISYPNSQPIDQHKDVGAMEELFYALMLDLRGESYEEMIGLASGETLMGVLRFDAVWEKPDKQRGNASYDFLVKSTYTNTLAVMEKHGLSFYEFKIEEHYTEFTIYCDTGNTYTDQENHTYRGRVEIYVTEDMIEKSEMLQAMLRSVGRNMLYTGPVSIHGNHSGVFFTVPEEYQAWVTEFVLAYTGNEWYIYTHADGSGEGFLVDDGEYDSFAGSFEFAVEPAF